MTDPLSENNRNPAKKQEKSVLKPFQIQEIVQSQLGIPNNNKHNMLALYKRWEKHNEI